MAERNFEDGEVTGESVLYYPNGKFYNKTNREISPTDTTTSYKECRDSTGKVLTENGNGSWITYNSSFTRIMEHGKVVDGLKEGFWTNNLSDSTLYRHGKEFHPVDIVPEYPGGIDAFVRFLSYNIKYPATAVENNVQGTVIISFIVDKDGSLSEIKVVKGIGSGCDEEAVRVIQLMPKWKPGSQNGKPVRVQYSVPINFNK